MDAVRAVVDWIARSPGRAFAVVFLLSLSVQGLVLRPFIPRAYFLPDTRWEVGAVADSLARTGQFADPYAVPSGPTAHLAPVYPGLVSVIYRVFGTTLAAGYVRWLLAIVGLAAMYAMIPWIAGRCGIGLRAGVLGGLAGALVPVFPAQIEPLAGVALGLLLMAFLQRWTAGRSSPGGSFLLGVAFGVSFHLLPSLLAVMLGCVSFELWWSRDRRKGLLALLMALGVVLACVPWAWRNYSTFHEVFFIRSNFGLELRVGNHEGAAADIDVSSRRGTIVHPRLTPEEARKVRDLGEIEYMRRARHEAVQWIVDHPAAFARLTALRMLYFWCGPLHDPLAAAGTLALTILALLGAWRVLPGLTTPQRAVLLIPLATFPLVYHLVAYMARYRVPITWILFLFAGAEVWRWIKPGLGRGR